MGTSTALDLAHFTHWLASGERGISSEAIVSHLTGQPVGRPWRGSDHPYDPGDFRRCQVLLETHPLAKLMFGKMRTRSAVWSRLVDHWDEIHAAIEAECPGYVTDRNARGDASRGYRLMRRVIADGTTCAACDGTGTAEPCSKCNGTCPTCLGDGYTGGVR